MAVGALIKSDQIIADLSIPNKHRLLFELSKKAAESLGLDSGHVLDAMLAREKLGSTGVGMGTAIPHARFAGLKSPFVMFARLARAIDYDSIDGVPVDLVFFVMLPTDSDKENLALLAEIAKRLRPAEFRAKLRGEPGSGELYRVLTG